VFITLSIFFILKEVFMKRIFVCIMISLVALFLIGSVTLAGSEEEEGKKPKKGKVQEMTLYHDNQEWQDFWVNFGEASGEDAGILAIPVDMETSVYMTRVKVDLTTERAPAVFKWWFGYPAYELVTADLLMDLSDVWDEVGHNFPEGVREALTIEGVTYAFPFLTAYWVWFYSKPVYERFDLEPPETWDEFMDQLELFKKNGVSGIGNTIGKSNWTAFVVPMELLIRMDADFYLDLMAGRAHWTDPMVVEMMELWKDLIDKGYFAPMDATYAVDQPRMLKEGSLAFAPYGDWYGGSLQGQGLVPDVDYGVFILPAINPEGEGAIAFEISPLCVGKNSDEAELGKEWMKWYGTEHAAQLLWEGRRFSNTVHISPDVIAKDDPILARIMELLDDYPKKLIRLWEATPVEIKQQAVDVFNTMLVEPERYMELLESIEKVAVETWPNYGVTDY
jgi:ABC-type glycerol-3-phosphate transport system substrate-binding protein